MTREQKKKEEEFLEELIKINESNFNLVKRIWQMYLDEKDFREQAEEEFEIADDLYKKLLEERKENNMEVQDD